MPMHLGHDDPARLARIKAARVRVYDNLRKRRLVKEAKPKPVRVSRGERWKRRLDVIEAMSANPGWSG